MKFSFLLALAIAVALPAAAEELGPELYISPKGEVRLTRAELVNIHSLNLFKVSIWGQKWTVQTIPISPYTRFEAANGQSLQSQDLATGHFLDVRGQMVPGAFGIIEAATIRDLSLKSGTGGVATALASSISGVSQLTKRLVSGMRGPEVALLQDFLWRRNWGIPDESFVTGYFGATTLAALKKFQASSGLPPEGEVGPRTRALINSLLKR